MHSHGHSHEDSQQCHGHGHGHGHGHEHGHDDAQCLDHVEDDPELEERKALGRIVFALRQYRHDAEYEISRWEENYSRLPPRHRVLLHTQPAKFAAARRAAYQNHFFLSAVLAAFKENNGFEQEEVQDADGAAAGRSDEGVGDARSGSGGAGNAGADGRGSSRRARSVSDAAAAGAAATVRLQQTLPGDTDKVRYVLKNLARDWSEEGAMERQQSYGRIIAELRAQLGEPPTEDGQPPRVLIPGAGLARLCVEVAAQGYQAQGNEFSYYMLLASSFILNHTACARQWRIHPWLHGTCNHVSDEDQLRGVAVPDVAPADLVRPGLLSMCAGDFVEVYSSPQYASSFDAVVTCFFLDTAHNVVEYLEIIHSVLRPGGYWIHLGPLLWHWADGSRDELSIEVSLAEVQRLARLHGFTLIKQDFVDTAYIGNVRAMYKTVYLSAFWTMQRTGPAPPDHLADLMRYVAADRQQQQQEQEEQQQQQHPSVVMHGSGGQGALGQAADPRRTQRAPHTIDHASFPADRLQQSQPPPPPR